MNFIRSLAVGLLLALPSALRAESGSIHIRTVPAEASVEVDGIAQGMSPVTASGLSIGRHLITVNKSGFVEARRSVVLMEGRTKADIEIPLEDLTGLALIHSVPSGAEVKSDGVSRGKTPLLLPNVSMGKHEITLSLPGFSPVTELLEIKDRTPVWKQVMLVSDSATVDVQSDPPGARVTINGYDQGSTPVRAARIPAGEAEVTVTMEGYQPYTKRIKLLAGEETAVNAALRAQPGRLQIITEPTGAKVYVANQYRGESPLLLKDLTPGPTRVRVELNGYEADARTVNVRAGDQVAEQFKLASNSGILVLVTEPPGVKVIIDGNERGETKPQAAGLLSEALRIDLLSRGDHKLQLVRSGYLHTPKTFSIEPGKAVTLTEKLKKLFAPDTRLIIRDESGTESIVQGALLQKHPDGDMEIETRPGVIIRVPAASIVEAQPIRATP